MARPRKPYILFKRGDVWYFGYYDVDGKRIIRSTGQRGRGSKGRAETYSYNAVKEAEGKPSRRNPTFEQYFDDWWTPECQYVRLKHADGAKLSPVYLQNCRSFLTHHIMPYFKDKRISSITVRDIEEWKLELRQKKTRFDKPMSAKSVNHILRTLKTMFREAVRMGDLDKDPTASVNFLRQEQFVKSYLSIPEMAMLFDRSRLQSTWGGDLRHYGINLLSASTGMRLGECQGLRNRFIKDGYVQVEWAWTRFGLVEPKARSKRFVPVRSKTAECLRELLASSPYNEPDGLVFFGVNGKRPIDQRTIGETLYAALASIGIAEADRRARNITFHSWRHGFDTICKARNISDAHVMQVMGHRTKRMNVHYTQKFTLEDLREVAQMQEELF